MFARLLHRKHCDASSLVDFAFAFTSTYFSVCLTYITPIITRRRACDTHEKERTVHELRLRHFSPPLILGCRSARRGRRTCASIIVKLKCHGPITLFAFFFYFGVLNLFSFSSYVCSSILAALGGKRERERMIKQHGCRSLSSKHGAALVRSRLVLGARINRKKSTTMSNQASSSPPRDFLCPITRELMQNPVLLIEDVSRPTRGTIT